MVKKGVKASSFAAFCGELSSNKYRIFSVRNSGVDIQALAESRTRDAAWSTNLRLLRTRRQQGRALFSSFPALLQAWRTLIDPAAGLMSLADRSFSAQGSSANPAFESC